MVIGAPIRVSGWSPTTRSYSLTCTSPKLTRGVEAKMAELLELNSDDEASVTVVSVEHCERLESDIVFGKVMFVCC